MDIVVRAVLLDLFLLFAVLDDQAHMLWVLWWHRVVPYRSYVKGFKIAPTHFINQDLAQIWLDK